LSAPYERRVVQLERRSQSFFARAVVEVLERLAVPAVHRKGRTRGSIFVAWATANKHKENLPSPVISAFFEAEAGRLETERFSAGFREANQPRVARRRDVGGNGEHLEQVWF